MPPPHSGGGGPLNSGGGGDGRDADRGGPQFPVRKVTPSLAPSTPPWSPSPPHCRSRGRPGKVDATAPLAGLNTPANARPSSQGQASDMDFTLSDRQRQWRDRVRAFMDRHVYPNEERFRRETALTGADRWKITPQI